MAPLLSVPLFKFSYTTNDASETNFRWTHAMQNLTLVFDHFRGDPNSLLMKVVQGARLLETLDIQDKISQTRRALPRLREANHEIRPDHLPLSVLYRCPLLALRFTLPDGKVRRVQMRFSAEPEYQQTFNLLSRIGCFMIASVSPRPSTAASSTVHSSSSSSRPATALPAATPAVQEYQTRSDTLGGSSSPALFRFSRDVNSVQPHGIQQPVNQSVSIQSRPNLEQYRPAHHYAEDSQSEYFPSQSQLQRNLTVPARDERGGYSQTDILDHVRGGGTPAGIFERSSAALHSQRDVPEPLRPGSGPAMPNRLQTLQLETIDELAETRPITAPASEQEASQRPVSLTSMIPPRRELPFKRPLTATMDEQRSSSRPSSARPSSTARPSSGRPSSGRPSSSNMDPPPLPASAMRQKKGEQADPTRPRSATKDLPPLELPKFVDTASRESALAKRPASRPDSRPSSGPSSRLSSRPSSPSARLLVPSSSVYFPPPSRQPASSSSADPIQLTTSSTKRPLHAIEDAEVNTRNRPRALTPDAPTQPAKADESIVPETPHPQADLNRAIDRVGAQVEDAADAELTRELPAYAAQPYETRRQSLDQFFAEAIDSDDFITLCEDVGACWRRFALGLPR